MEPCYLCSCCSCISLLHQLSPSSQVFIVIVCWQDCHIAVKEIFQTHDAWQTLNKKYQQSAWSRRDQTRLIDAKHGQGLLQEGLVVQWRGNVRHSSWQRFKQIRPGKNSISAFMSVLPSVYLTLLERGSVCLSLSILLHQFVSLCLPVCHSVSLSVCLQISPAFNRSCHLTL